VFEGLKRRRAGQAGGRVTDLQEAILKMPGMLSSGIPHPSILHSSLVVKRCRSSPGGPVAD
jgi:hypothetical protein